MNKPLFTDMDIAAHARAIRICSIAHFLPAVAIGVLGLVGMSFGDYALAGVVLSVAAAHAITGWGLMTLKSWARIPTCLLSGLALLGFPVGTLIHGYVLYAVFGDKGVAVFAAQRGKQGPTTKSKTSPIVWAGVCVIALLVTIVAIVTNA